MEVINDLVGYENLKIYQNEDWFKFSLESVLLPRFVTINLRCKNILDLCTGNAPIPLILSTRTSAKMYGVEIQEDVYNLANKTIELNNLSKQITIINDNIMNLFNHFEVESMDVVTVNPPYFKREASFDNEDIHKTIARHEVSVNLEDIIKISSKVLKTNGYFAMVHRTERMLEIIKLMEQNNIKPKKMQFIYPKEGCPSNLFMIEGIKNGRDGLCLLSPLFVHNSDGSYCEEVKKLFG